MASKKRPLLTDDGDPLPAAPANHDVLAAIHLLEYARTRGFRIAGALKVGSVEILVEDMRQGRGQRGGGGDSIPDPYSGTAEPEPGTAG